MKPVTSTRSQAAKPTYGAQKFVASLLLLAAAALAAPSAQAQGTQFSLTCIGTETGSAINFMYRWGDGGEWKSARVEPGSWQAISYRYSYAGENRAPQLQVRFDDDMSGGVNMVRQGVKSYAARNKDCEGEGFTYQFITRRGELFLESGESDSRRGGGGVSL